MRCEVLDEGKDTEKEGNEGLGFGGIDLAGQWRLCVDLL